MSLLRQIIVGIVLSPFIFICSAIAYFKLLFRWMRNCGHFFYTEEHPPPPVLDGWRHGYAQLKEVRLHYVECGDPSHPLMLFVHGFPEFWYSWRFQMKHFQKNYHVVAIDMRGYNDSEKPVGIQNYATSHLVNDLVELIGQLGGKAIVVCHDWGGIVSWLLAAYHPQLVERLIVMNVPHAGATRKYARSHPGQAIAFWYMFWFVCPYLPEATIRAKDYDFIDDMFRGKRAGIKHPENFTDDDLEAWKHALSKPNAVKSALNYYRALFFADGSLPVPTTKIEPKTLIIWGAADVVLSDGLADASAECCRDATVRKIPGASHWVQQDRPDAVNTYIEEFLNSL